MADPAAHSPLVWMPPTLAATFFWGLGQGLVKKYIDDVSPARFCLYYVLARSVVMGGYFLYALAGGEVEFASGLGAFAAFGLASYMLDGIGWVLYYESIISGPITIVGTLSAAYPALTVILARFFLGEQLGDAQLAGVLLVIASCIGLSIPTEKDVTARVRHGRWVPLACTALLLWGVAGTLLKHAYNQPGASEPLMSLLGITGGMLTLGLYGLARGRRKAGAPSDPGEWKRSALPMAVMGSGDLGVLIAAKTGPASIVTPLSAAYPVVTLGFAWLVLKERITPLQWCLVAAILVGVSLTSMAP